MTNMQLNPNRQRAVELLTHYMSQVYRAVGLNWSEDNDDEMGQLVDLILAAANNEAEVM